jgi:anti-sigma factor RsiW
MTMTCREASTLLPLFFDGELDAHQMRSVALHSTRCSTCESELREMERMQDLIGHTVSAAVEEIDLGDFWPAVERRLGTLEVSWWLRLRAWWDDGEHEWLGRLPALATAAALAVLMVWLFRASQPTMQPDAPQVAAADSTAMIESVETDVDSVAVLNDPETRTTVLWVGDTTFAGGDEP